MTLYRTLEKNQKILINHLKLFGNLKNCFPNYMLINFNLSVNLYCNQQHTGGIYPFLHYYY